MHLLRHSVPKMIIFPRQARDKLRESTLKKRRVFLQKRVSLGKHYASLAQKVFVFQFLNTVGLTVLLNSQFVHAGLPVVGDGKWYYTVGADLIQVMMMNVVVPPTVSDENSVFWEPFCIQTIMLPRQARDKHRKTQRKRTVFCRSTSSSSSSSARCSPWQRPGRRWC
jgi:hypothetical protein